MSDSSTERRIADLNDLATVMKSLGSLHSHSDRSTAEIITVARRNGRGRYKDIHWIYLEIAGYGSYHLKTQRVQMDTTSGNYHVFADELQLSKVSTSVSPIGPGVVVGPDGHAAAKPQSYFPAIASNPSSPSDPGLTVNEALEKPDSLRRFLENGLGQLSL